MPAVDRFAAAVEVNGQRCQEYYDEELTQSVSGAPAPTIATYIEARSGQQFRVRMDLLDNFVFPLRANSISWEVYMDGKHMESRLALFEDYIKDGTWKDYAKSSRTKCGDTWARYPYMFCDLDISQDSVKGDHNSLLQQYGSLGTIEVRVMPYHTWGLSPATSSAEAAPSAKSVSEKALKGRAITLGAVVGDAIPCPEPKTYKGFKVDNKPLAKFVFHYRTKKSLQDLMVIPRDDAVIIVQNEVVGRKSSTVIPKAEVKKEFRFAVKRESGVHQLDDDDILEIREVKKPRAIHAEVIEIDSD